MRATPDAAPAADDENPQSVTRRIKWSTGTVCRPMTMDQPCETTRTGNAGQPLERFYASAGLKMPELALIEGSAVPQPYRRLLVHDHDMTPTLEAFFDREITLKVIEKHLDGHDLLRQVVLVTVPERRAGAYGAIRIYLDRFDDHAREEILECKRPLGSILAREHVPHMGHPTAYFAVTPDETIREALGVEGNPTLYGRHNELLTDGGGVLAQVVEIMPVFEDESEAT